MYQKVLRLLWYIQVILFWGILAYHEPVFIVLRLRKTKEFSPRTLALLAGSVLLSSLIWIGMLDTIILASKEIGKQILNHLL
jgi:hypothetical protein